MKDPTELRVWPSSVIFPINRVETFARSSQHRSPHGDGTLLIHFGQTATQSICGLAHATRRPTFLSFVIALLMFEQAAFSKLYALARANICFRFSIRHYPRTRALRLSLEDVHHGPLFQRTRSVR